MPEKYELVYFDLKGRAELIRFMLVYSGVDFEDTRITKEDWLNVKPEIPGGQLPILKVTKEDGTKFVITQSMTIARYLAEKLGLKGDNLWQSARCDEIVDTLMDAVLTTVVYWYETVPARKQFLKNKLMNEDLPTKFDFVTKLIKSGGAKYAVCDKLTWADFAIAWFFSALPEYVEPDYDLAERFPVFAEITKTLEEIPQIAKYISERPNVAPYKASNLKYEASK